MTLTDLTQKTAGLKVREVRENRDDYQEKVIFNSDMKKWEAVLKELLGPPVKPAGVAPSGSDLVLCQIYGSIMDNQILYRKSFGDVTVLAMFWPWNDGAHTTLKIGIITQK